MPLDEKLLTFKNEIQNGLAEISKNYAYIDEKVNKPEYVCLLHFLALLED